MICVHPRTRFAVAVLTGFMISSGVWADWWQFQGPTRNGVSPESGLMRSWPEGGPRELWSFPLGEGYAGPAVRDGEIYILDRVEERQDVLRCLDLATGAELWNYAYDAPGSVGHSGSRTPPTVTETHVYSVGMLGDFLCVDRKTHQPVWRKNILADFGNKPSSWGVSQAPSLWRDLVIVAPQADDAFVAAYQRETGELVWQSPGLGKVGYVTPVVTTLAGVEQAVMVAAYGQTAGISLENGSILWAYDGFQCQIPIPYPTPLSGDRLFITGGYDAGSAMIQIKREGDGFGVTELFRTDECGSQIHQPLVYDGHLYAHSNTNSRTDGMICMTLDGQLKWRTRDSRDLPQFERGNLLLADGMIISLDGKTGMLHLIEPSPEGYKELARAKIFDGNKMWSPMALSQGRLLLRDQETMKCLDLKNP
ncbi:MAG: PQQ-binding-like beta-propeller repeat protein [Candidatus Hydrogenedentes bacterium]|nr:PQQ-binding-like beta-propeller repeat protein [Candidatus Hydrogenedentota bacterium]HNV21818.1 PQQ-binding-like beta-propeller repeat protein [Candidatus Hydrogenedentota bacterium]HPV37211.1 PQQ-binding-like beta-propeller repeat protein [Candidatus Hydrogenedentota bacterium]HPX39420.1 PQQ-binding-like beta-propeller repeat protein [Candidatus Hydrogenedentota bacterium]